MTYVRELKFAVVLAGLAAGLFAPVSAHASTVAIANNAVVLSSEALIERTEQGADGKERTVIKKPSDVIVVPGDRVIFTLKYKNNGVEPAKGFRATNPMPGPVQFLSAAEAWADVSVDNGVTWGKLDQLKVKKAAVEGGPAELRPAMAEDVTHVRWVFADVIAPGSSGSVSFRGIIK